MTSIWRVYVADIPKTWHFLVIFVAAMLTHPDIQEKAREEIDRVVGRDRLPDFNDRDSLQYVRCIIDEVLRYVLTPRQFLLYDTLV